MNITFSIVKEVNDTTSLKDMFYTYLVSANNIPELFKDDAICKIHRYLNNRGIKCSFQDPLDLPKRHLPETIMQNIATIICNNEYLYPFLDMIVCLCKE